MFDHDNNEMYSLEYAELESKQDTIKNVPAEMKKTSAWYLYEMSRNDKGLFDKKPLHPVSCKPASKGYHEDPNFLVTHEGIAEKLLQIAKKWIAGFAVWANHPFVVLDIDNCLKKESEFDMEMCKPMKPPKDWVIPALTEFKRRNCYIEYSASDTGLHVIWQVPDKRELTQGKFEQTVSKPEGEKAEKFELFYSKMGVAITGRPYYQRRQEALPTMPFAEMLNCLNSLGLNALTQRMLNRVEESVDSSSPAAVTPLITDVAVSPAPGLQTFAALTTSLDAPTLEWVNSRVKSAQRKYPSFKALHEGGDLGCTDTSSMDWQYFKILAQVTQGDAHLIKVIASQSKRSEQHEKWQNREDDYVNVTIQKVVAQYQDENRKAVSETTVNNLKAAIDLMAELLNEQYVFNEECDSWMFYQDQVWMMDYRIDKKLRKIIYQHLTETDEFQSFCPNVSPNLIKSIKEMLELKMNCPGLNSTVHWIPFQNGILDLATQTLFAHHPSHYLGWILPVDYDPGYQDNYIEQYLIERTGSIEVVKIIQAFLRCAISGLAGLQLYLEITGGAGSGKSTLTKIIELTLDKSNCVDMNFSRIAANPRFEGMKLFGKRLAIFNDEDKAVSRETTETLKRWIGEDNIVGEIKGKNIFPSFKPTHLTVITANYPIRWNPDDAFARRRISIRMDKIIGQEHQKDDLIDNDIMPHLQGWINQIVAIPLSEAKQILRQWSKIDGLKKIRREELLANPLVRFLDEFTYYFPFLFPYLRLKPPPLGG